MSQGTFSDTLIRLQAFKRIFVFRPKIDFFPMGKSKVFGWHFSLVYVPTDLGVLQNSLGNHL